MPQPLPPRPIDADLVEKMQQTVDQRAAIESVVRGITGQGLRNVYFVGAGGSIICSYPAHYILQRRAEIPSFQLQSDELNCSAPRLMGPGSLVVLASYTGTTKETVEAAKTAKSTGAKVIAVAREGSPLAEAVDVAFKGKSDLFEVLVAYAVLAATGSGIDDGDAITAALAALPKATLSAVEESDDRLRGIAAAIKDEPIIYTLGSGPSYGWAYGLAMCYLQEMQWKHAAGFNAGEFFQGAFEMVTEDTAVLLFLGEDATRPMAERAQRFLDTYTRKAHYIDVRDLSLPGIPEELRGDVSTLVIAELAGRLAQHFEAVRGHHLDQRRYMFRVQY
ncbi:MAG TPA: SIS domain-containing protein [Nocardioidaceae bacterium]|nr:SIS domain-containing protein [Nocardioidaceae bacterium]